MSKLRKILVTVGHYVVFSFALLVVVAPTAFIQAQEQNNTPPPPPCRIERMYFGAEAWEDGGTNQLGTISDKAYRFTYVEFFLSGNCKEETLYFAIKAFPEPNNNTDLSNLNNLGDGDVIALAQGHHLKEARDVKMGWQSLQLGDGVVSFNRPKANLKPGFEHCEEPSLASQLWNPNLAVGFLVGGPIGQALQGVAVGSVLADFISGIETCIYYAVASIGDKELSAADGDVSTLLIRKGSGNRIDIPVKNRILAYICDDNDWFWQESICTSDWRVDQTLDVNNMEEAININSPCFDPVTGLEREDCQALLAPIPGFGSYVDEELNLPKYINTMITIVIGLMGLGAVMIVIFSGVQLMTTDAVTGKIQAKKNISNALLGILIAAGSFIIFRTINPDILDLNIGVQTASLNLNPEGDRTIGSGTLTSFSLPSSLGIYCPGTGGSAEIPKIVESFKGVTTYRLGGKGGPLPEGKRYYGDTNLTCGNQRCVDFCPPNQICTDCSGFANHVLKCAGLDYDGGIPTLGMFKSSKAIRIKSWRSVDGKTVVVDSSGTSHELRAGDLVGNPSDHVLIYIGDGKFADSHGGSGWQTGRAIGVYEVSQMGRYKYLRKFQDYP